MVYKNYKILFIKKAFALFDFSQKGNYKTKILADLTVAITMISESLDHLFAIFTDSPALTGLYVTFIAALIFHY